MALSGDLGRGFPVELLSRLHAAVSTRAASAATPRWLVFRKPMTEVDGLVAALHLPIATGEATKPRGCR
jgi:hypothetical protein